MQGFCCQMLDESSLSGWQLVIYPTATYLHRIGVVGSSVCPYCTMGVDETFTHFACICPRFRQARTAAHNRAWWIIAGAIRSHLDSGWRMFVEVPLALIPLDFRFENDPGWRRWQPDSVVISLVHRKIGILEFTRPADLHVDQLQAARLRKETKYGPIKLALLGYETKGWQVQISLGLWVFGVWFLLRRFRQLHLS